MRLDFGEDQLDRLELWRVRRKIQELRANRFDRFLNAVETFALELIMVSFSVFPPSSEMACVPVPLHSPPCPHPQGPPDHLLRQIDTMLDLVIWSGRSMPRLT
jgi:hypothetical protein